MAIRKLSFFILFLCMLLQSVLTYRDPTTLAGLELSSDAVKGRRFYQLHNCQACHQVFGFGGFLGPDLTNRGHYISPEVLKNILKAGPGVMPSFIINDDEAKNIHAYFVELNSIGISVATAENRKLDFLSIPWFEFLGENKR